MAKCYCFNLRRAANKISALYDQFFAPLKITASQYSILAHLKKRLDPVTVSELAKIMGLDRTTLVRNLKPLEDKDLIWDIAQSGRGRQLILSEKGRLLQGQAEEAWQAAQAALETKLDPDDLQNLQLILAKLMT